MSTLFFFPMTEEDVSARETLEKTLKREKESEREEETFFFRKQWERGNKSGSGGNPDGTHARPHGRERVPAVWGVHVCAPSVHAHVRGGSVRAPLAHYMMVGSIGEAFAPPPRRSRPS
jgi:hypothetical protein